MEVYSGILTVKVPSVLKNKMYKNFLCILFTGSLFPRIELYENKTHVDQTERRKIIYIEEVKWKKVESPEPSFSFETKHKQYIFSTASIPELRLWILVLCCISKDLFNTRHIIGIKELDKTDTNSIMKGGEDFVVEENILYASSTEMSSFIVVADQSDECQKHGLQGPYKMQIGQESVQLLQCDTEKEILCWPLCLLRKYGHSHTTFFFQAGSRTVTGIGMFIFLTIEGESITRCIKACTDIIYAKNSEKTEILRSATLSGIVKGKPPALPNKPKSFKFRKSSNETCEVEHEESQSINDHQLAKKNTPVLGVPVLFPLTVQTSKLRVSDSVATADEYESLNGLDLPFSYHEENNKHMMLTRSVSSQSSEPGSKKEYKKAQKEAKREQKKREEEEKKEKKRREEEKRKEQKRREEDEKKIRKEQKKSKQKGSRTLSDSSQVSTDHSSVNSKYHEENLSSVAYSEVDVEINSFQSFVGNTNSERIYSEPWGTTLPLMPILLDRNAKEVEYAQPVKISSGHTINIEPREVVHEENYSNCQIEGAHYSASALIPPNWEQKDDDYSTDLYSHLHSSQRMSTTQDNVYGLASASEVVNVLDVFEDENPYEDTNIPE